MGGGKMRIGAIKRMSRAVIVKAMRHRRSEGADIRSIAEGLFVDIIPDLKNRLDLLRDHVGIGGEPPLFPVLAGRQRKTEVVGTIRYRPGSTGTAGRIAEMKAIEIRASRLEAADLQKIGRASCRERVCPYV